MQCQKCGAALSGRQRLYCSPRCRQRAASKRYAERHPDRERERKKRFYKSDAGRAFFRAWDEAHREENREACRRWREKHPDYADYQRRWREANPERTKQYNRTWSQKNPEKVADQAQVRRARKKGAPHVEKIDREAIYERDGGRCHLCGRKCSRKSFTLDHLVPLARGGDHTATNVRVAHLKCNVKRGVDRAPAQLLLV